MQLVAYGVQDQYITGSSSISSSYITSTYTNYNENKIRYFKVIRVRIELDNIFDGFVQFGKREDLIESEFVQIRKREDLIENG